MQHGCYLHPFSHCSEVLFSMFIFQWMLQAEFLYKCKLNQSFIRKRISATSIFFFIFQFRPFELSIIHFKLSIIHFKLSIIQFEVYNCRLYTLNCRLYTSNCRLYTSNCRLYSLKCIIDTLNCRLYTSKCRLYTSNCRLFTLIYSDFSLQNCRT